MKSSGFFVNSTPLWAPAFKKVNIHFIDILQRTWLPVLILATVMFPISQFFEFMTKSPQIAHGALLGSVGEMLISIFNNVTLLMIAPLRVRDSLLKRANSNLSDFAQRHFTRLFVEALRATASVLLWTLALIIPGIYRQLRLYFVFYIVFFDKDYQDGQVDALDRSSQITASLSFSLGLVLVVTAEGLFGFGLVKLISSLNLVQWSLTHLAISFGKSLILMTISIYAYSLIYCAFEARYFNLFGKPLEGE